MRGPEPSGIEYQRSEQQIRDASTRLDGQRHAIHVMDREADDYQMFDALIHDKHRFVARALADRNVETEAGDTKYRALLRTQPATIEREVPLTSRRRKGNPHKNKTHPPRTARTARLMFAATYRARWVIEEYFHAIKTGCRFQERQLEDYEGLVNLLATFAPIAYHLLLLRSEARRVPEAAARTVLSDEQLVVLRVLGRVKLSAQPTLGGHIKYNGDPGWGTPAYGFEELQSLTAGWVAAKLQARRDQ